MASVYQAIISSKKKPRDIGAREPFTLGARAKLRVLRICESAAEWFNSSLAHVIIFDVLIVAAAVCAIIAGVATWRGYPAALLLVLPLLAFCVYSYVILRCPWADDFETRYAISNEMLFDKTVSELKQKPFDLVVAFDGECGSIVGMSSLVHNIFSEKKDWLGELLRIMSAGHSTASFTSMSDCRERCVNAPDVETETVIGEMLSEYDKGFRELEDLLSIWAHYPDCELFALRLGNWTCAEDARRIADMLGVESMLDAYYSGVPVEDVVA